MCRWYDCAASKVGRGDKERVDCQLGAGVHDTEKLAGADADRPSNGM